MEHKDQTRWGLIIVSLFFIGLAVDYFFLHLLFQQKIKEQQKQEEVPPLEKTKPSSQSEANPSGPTEIAYKETTQEALPEVLQEPLKTSLSQFQANAEKCLGVGFAKSTPDSLIQDLEKINSVQATHFELDNTHVRLLDGSMRRLHLIAAENANAKNTLELRYFSLDEEGLPVRINLKPEQTFDPSLEFIESLKKQGTVTYHETRENKILQDGTTLSLTLINDKVYEFQIFGKGKSLSCREFSCLCR